MKEILVTGGAGYVGAHACKALRRAGYQPIVFDNLKAGSRAAVRWGDCIEGDLLDPRALAAAFERVRPEAVLHFAALAYVGESVVDPGRYYRNNFVGSLNLLEAMRAAGCSRIVFSSTCAIYGVPDAVPIAESAPQRPINPYGRSKRMVEEALRDFDTAHGVRSVCLRYFNASGADPELEAGEEHDPETHLIPLLLQVAAGKRPSLLVHGGDYPTPDGTCIRDYIHVSDLAEAHLLALRHLERGGATAAFNLGTGVGHSVREMIDAAARVTGRPIAHSIGERRPGDPPVLVADGAVAARELGWRPRYLDIDDHLRHAWAWLSSR